MAEQTSVTRLFADFQTWMKEQVPDVKFRPPVEVAALDHFSNLSGVEMPQMLRTLLLIADGETRTSAGAIGNWRMLPVKEIQAAWGLLTKLADKGAFSDQEPKASPYIRHIWWHPGWIPFVSSDLGHYFCIDTDPIEPVRKGQVILFLQNQPERVLIAGNLLTWFTRILLDLKSGVYHYDSKTGFDGEGFLWSALEGKHLLDDHPGELIV